MAQFDNMYNMNRKKITLWRFIPMLCVMIIIFIFSAMPAEESTSTSGMFLNALKTIVEGVSKKALSEDVLSAMHLVIRKLAHFSEYAVLGASIMFAAWNELKGKRFSILLPELIAALYAVTDEIHQRFVPGRYGTWSDVLIDSTGAITGILIYLYITRQKKKPSNP